MPAFKQLAMALASSLILAVSPAQAHGVKCGDLSIAHPYSTPSLGASKTGAVYFIHIKNNGKATDLLTGASTDLAANVEIHEMRLDNGIMKMRTIPEIQLPPGFEVSLKHGQANGYHLMLMDLKKPTQSGDKFPVTLKFSKAGDCRVEVWVETPKPEAHAH